MYKKKRKFAFFGRPHKSLRGEKKSDETKKKKKTTGVIACYCWKEDGHLFQSLLLSGLFSCCCFLCFLFSTSWFVPFLWTALK